jgi:hypothetical protein
MNSMDYMLIIGLTVYWLVILLSLNFMLVRLVPMPKKIADDLSGARRKVNFVNFTSNTVSFVHAVVSFVWGISLYLRHGLRFSGTNSFVECMLLSFSLGYFLNDTILSWVYKLNDLPMMIHHYICVFVIVYSLVKDEYSSMIVWALVVAEASNPFNILRVTFEVIEGFQILGTIFSLAFAVIFIYCR